MFFYNHLVLIIQKRVQVVYQALKQSLMGMNIQGRRSYNVFPQLPNNPRFLPHEQRFQGIRSEIFRPLDSLCKSLKYLMIWRCDEREKIGET
ncbi:hypothetical protein HanXRQr2_Chr14g0662341 [Helianthus annuus]|uniref:Uncharacterized protein n=1 Tax=Helianthus annuus TaxID=4232 RepID=A0A9K3H947_HELAN|nr:hypothetical protein HanXRQr2_Chr14g0662341 [Helianthus annuus]KAJ0841898.1 hypothetical protein HanPSC8_Chr14g0635611 [Helianthus annuus]